MKRYRLTFGFVFALFVSLAAPGARANAVDTFTWSVPGRDILWVWQLPASPTVFNNSSLFSVEAKVSGINPSGPTLVTIDFSPSGPTNLNGGFDVEAYAIGFHLSNGEQLFSGTISSPTFIPGIYNGFFEVSGQDFTPSTLTIATTSNTPEPSGLLLLSGGLALILLGKSTAKQRFLSFIPLR